MKKYQTTQNAKVDAIYIGSARHDGRGFFTITFTGSSWGQGFRAPFEPQWIDRFIDVCGGGDLLSCVGKLVRVHWDCNGLGPIVAVSHIVSDETVEVRV